MLIESRQDQTAPEYAQSIFKNALGQETAVGDYFDGSGSELCSSPAHRKEMVYLVEILSHKKQYKEETVYLAVNIADRYMSIMA